MTISSSLNASVAALNANANRLATISDNIANASTKGYKRVETEFHSMVVSENAGKYSAGGVRTTTKRLIDETAGFITTANATDLAISGRGMLPVMKEGDLNEAPSERTMMLMTTGSFRKDENGFLKTESGLLLLGWPALADGSIPSFSRDSAESLSPIKINSNQFSGDPTKNIDFKINLPAKATEKDQEKKIEKLSINYYDNLGGEKSLYVTFKPETPQDGIVASNKWVMTIKKSEAADANVISTNTLEFYDTRGQGGRLKSVVESVGDNDDTLDKRLGKYDPTTGKITIKVSDSNGGDDSANTIDINLGLIGKEGGITQVSSPLFSSTIEKDGAPVGTISDYEVNNKGQVVANFKTGVSKALYQIPLVDVPNINGVEAIDRQTYLPTPESGSFFLWDAETGPTGRIVSRVLEESATDVANELTSLIQTQRAYSSNAKVIQTVDEMLQETTNIKR